MARLDRFKRVDPAQADSYAELGRRLLGWPVPADCSGTDSREDRAGVSWWLHRRPGYAQTHYAVCFTGSIFRRAWAVPLEL